MTDKEFFAKIKNDVITDMKESGILASLTAAQGFCESAHGSSGLTQKANNLFGMKGSYNGQYVTMKTKEFVNGKYITVDAAFRKYPDWLSSIKDHSALFNRLARYKNLRGLRDYKLACTYVQQDGYATSPSYASTLINIIEKYKLYEWDLLEPEPVQQDPELDAAIEVIAQRVIAGRFGVGHENRKEKIYELIKTKVNDILK